jgi:hypothetical protein
VWWIRLPAARSRRSAFPWLPPPCRILAAGVSRHRNRLGSRWGVFGPGEILGLLTTAAATPRRRLGAVCLLGGAAADLFPTPTSTRVKTQNPFGLDGGGATGAAPFLEAPSGVRGSQRGLPNCGKLVSSNSKATRMLSLLCSAPLWLKLLVAMECSSLGGALHGLVFSGGISGNTSSCSRVNVSMPDGAAPFDPGREGRVPLRHGRRMMFLCHLKLII